MCEESQNTYLYDKAKRIAANLIGLRMYTCHEIEDRLLRKKIDRETAERVVCEFAAAGALDDTEYAKAYVEESVRLGGKGMYRIKQELFRKGVAKSIVEKVCAEADECDTYSALCEYVESRRLNEGITSRRELEKLKARLARRGYSYSEIRKCLDKYDFDFENEF